MDKDSKDRTTTTTFRSSQSVITPPALPPRNYDPNLYDNINNQRPTKTFTTITWPPLLETHIITARLYNGAIATISAHQTTNTALFPSYTLINTTTTRPPPTTVIGLNPLPPYVSGVSPSSSYSDDDGSNGSSSKAALIRTWALVVAGIVLVALVGGLFVRRYRMRIGRAKKQEPVRHFMTVGEDDGESDRGMGGSHISVSGLGAAGTIDGSGGGVGDAGGTLPDGSIALSNMGGASSQQHYSSQSSSNNVRERRNSQPVPRQLELDGKLRP
jgi:hypothetical protein